MPCQLPSECSHLVSSDCCQRFAIVRSDLSIDYKRSAAPPSVSQPRVVPVEMPHRQDWKALHATQFYTSSNRSEA
ncbi:hypothetical protein JZ751_022220 [Albula glossodonta]|uniref:Uncharacterized protein n=1 Tax=Albula glossodonta TaxID=121402 RepID=A0A8T2NU84_9TELE|nr:hypothetical protein JZ751_022220 [Albula glossodonta]